MTDPPLMMLASGQILAAVCRAWGINSIEALCSHRRWPTLVHARFAAVRILRDRFRLSWSHAAASIGRADRASAIHAYRRAAHLATKDAEFARRLQHAEKILDSAGSLAGR